jgi:hypothetical protein
VAGIYTWKGWSFYLEGLVIIPGRAGLYTRKGWYLYLEELAFISGRAGLYTWADLFT